MKRDNWVAFLPFYLLVIIASLGIAQLGSRTVTALHQQKAVERKWCVVIDAGHGGIDGGATSCTGVLESQINLEIALRLEDLFHFLGYETKMIRKTDESIYTEGNTIAAQKVSDLKERVRIVNETDNAFLLSIHQNTFSDRQYSGAQVFYGSVGNSRKAAEGLQGQLVSALKSSGKRKAKQAKGVYLMEHIQREGLLLECGFLTNPTEEARLRDDMYQKKLCCVIASSLSQYFSAT